jgi:glyoxylase-like metal-dependent hydrolase (beta-lactamase superfamily II)
MDSDEPLEERRIGAVTVLFGERGGKYPQGNTLAVRGSEECLVIDPSLGLLPRSGALPPADRVLNSHCHEDHVAGNHLFPDVPWHLHEEDLPCIRSIDAFMGVYGFPEPIHSAFREQLVERFHVVPRPDALGYADGDVFDLGGGVRVRVIHAPGHTRGHCVLHVEPDDVLYLADIDLSSFGPYYGDAWSSLEDFERTLEKVRSLSARHYATFHHIGDPGSRGPTSRLPGRAPQPGRDREAPLRVPARRPRALRRAGRAPQHGSARGSAGRGRPRGGGRAGSLPGHCRGILIFTFGSTGLRTYTGEVSPIPSTSLTLLSYSGS